MGSVFWPVVAVVGLLCLLSIRAQLRRLVRRLDLLIPTLLRSTATTPEAPARTHREAHH
jgi:hypothetical protein